MDLRQLEYFVAVAEERSFTRGARRVHIVQSAVSAAVGKLERELEASLLDRRGREVLLTDAGQALLPEARATLAAAQAGRDAIALVRGGLRGVVTIGSLLSIGPVDLPAVLGRFHAAHPHVTVRLRHSPTGSSGHLQALLEGALDLALISVPGPAPAGLTMHRLASEPLRLICPPDHALALRRRVAVAELATEVFIDFPAGWGNRLLVDRAFADAGLERSVPFEIADYSTVVALVRQGFGVAFLPESALAVVHGLPVMAVTSPALIWSVSVATETRRRLSAAARALVAELRSPEAAEAPGAPGVPSHSP